MKHGAQLRASLVWRNVFASPGTKVCVVAAVPWRQFIDTDRNPYKGAGMSSTIVALRVAGTIFGIMCVAQLARLFLFGGVEVLVAGHAMPLWPSAIAAAILAALSLWMWKVSYVSNR